ncbi:MAG: phage tail protein [Candidatus Thiodiazotropha sp. (ex Lucinoma borealis)]|nr:phage tail protein [Candidatus Thiodiazotropha sp. (ex Lucinoma borealis)]
MAEFLNSFNFSVHLTISGLGGDEGLIRDPEGAFSEVTGLEYQIEMTALREGGYNQGVRKLVTKTTQPELVLKRGMTADAAFWEWVQRCTDGAYPLPYINGTLEIYGPASDKKKNTPAKWRFANGIVTKVTAPGLNASETSAVPIEELHISHEGLWREAL